MFNKRTIIFCFDNNIKYNIVYISSKHLVKSCVYDLFPWFTNFGKYINDDGTFAIIFGIYQCLVKLFKGVGAEFLHNYFLLQID